VPPSEVATHGLIGLNVGLAFYVAANEEGRPPRRWPNVQEAHRSVTVILPAAAGAAVLALLARRGRARPPRLSCGPQGFATE
jgi:hypothetical protein